MFVVRLIEVCVLADLQNCHFLVLTLYCQFRKSKNSEKPKAKQKGATAVVSQSL